MNTVIQRVKRASVSVDGKEISKIDRGLLILLGIAVDDDQEDIDWLARKITNLRIFDDENGVMNRSLTNIEGNVIIVSQFTLLANTKKGNRPSYIKAARPETAIPLYKKFIDKIEELTDKKAGTGIFGADMQVELINDGPVTIIIDTKNKQ